MHVVSLLALIVTAMSADPADTQGYARMPSVRGDTIVFVAEGDLWRVPVAGGRATRLTTHPGEERMPAISPDGSTLAFLASYEGAREVYTMPMSGGLPTRRTFGVTGLVWVGWGPGGSLLVASDNESPIGAARVSRIDLATGERSTLPLAQCADAAFIDPETIVFTRLEFQGSHTDRYVGGTAQQLWRFTLPALGARGAEATPLTKDYDGTSKAPMTNLAGGQGRVYFLSDRSGRMNVWSMKPDGTDLRQLSKEDSFDIGGAALDGSTVVYQLGPDLKRLDVAAGTTATIPIALDSDFDQTRERWIVDPSRETSSVSVSPDGAKVVATVRGRVFVVPAKDGRTVDLDPRPGIRYRAASFLDEKTVVAFSDEWGELELVLLPANGVGSPTRLTTDGATMRWQALASSDGTQIAHTDKRLRLWVFDRASGTSRLVEENGIEDIGDLAWSDDSSWLAYVAPAANLNRQVKIWSRGDGSTRAVTTDRYDSMAPSWSPDGKWLWLRSDRFFDSSVDSPWGSRAPEPFLARTGKLFALSLSPGERWPFRPNDELTKPAAATEKDKPKEPTEKPADKPAEDVDAKPDAKPEKKPEPAKVDIALDGLSSRLFEVPMPPSNLDGSPVLSTGKALFWIAYDPVPVKRGEGGTLYGMAIENEKPEPKVVMTGVRSAQLSRDRKKILVRRGESWQIIDAAPQPAGEKGEKVEKGGRDGIDFGAIVFSTSPRDEWRQMLVDAWRMLRDYFYDARMHGADWKAVRAKYEPWVNRVRSRDELNDVLQELTGELSALHHFVRGDARRGIEKIEPASLGAEFRRDQTAGGYIVTAIPSFDPDEPWARPPLAVPGVDVVVGDTILAIDGVATLSAPDISALLRAKAGRQTLLRVKSAKGEERDVIATPVPQAAYADLRYRGWEVERRRRVDERSNGEIGYVHLRAMGAGDFGDFVRDYYPVFARRGLILDVRSNDGGNIDSWILSRLIRKAWMFWNQSVGRQPLWNMQFAFRGHMVVLCDESTASDGEAFTEGFRRLGLGKVIGTRTWGGEIWLSSSNRLVDGGIASAGEFGVFDETGAWLIEGRGVEPDLTVDNLPHATFFGDDTQLDAAIAHLQELIAKDPRDVPPVPPTPVKAK